MVGEGLVPREPRPRTGLLVIGVTQLSVHFSSQCHCVILALYVRHTAQTSALRKFSPDDLALVLCCRVEGGQEPR